MSNKTSYLILKVISEPCTSYSVYTETSICQSVHLPKK